MEIIALFDYMRNDPFSGLMIGEKAKRINKRYCIGQPQIEEGKFLFTDSVTAGVINFGSGSPEYPIMVIDCKGLTYDNQRQVD